MKYKILLLLLLGVIQVSYAQVITIKDKQTGETIPLASIVSETGKHAVSNSNGQAEISGITGQIGIRCLGYKSVVTNIDKLKEDNYVVLMSKDVFTIDNVVVSATRWHQFSNNIPARIKTISVKSIEVQNPQTAADLLGTSGEVYIQKSQQGGGSPMIRGFATNRLLYAVDGVRMNTAIFRGGNIQNVINLDPFATENVEILFGPGSVIYGSDAIGGVMSFNTLTPQLSVSDSALITGKAITRYSTANNEKTAHFDVNLGWEKWALVSSFTSWDFGHLRQGKNGQDDYLKPYYVQRQDSVDKVIYQDDKLLQIPTAYSQKNLMQKVRFKPNKTWDFQYGFHYSETSPYGRYDRHNRMRNGLPRYAEWNYGPQIWMMNNLLINNTSSNILYDELSIRLAHQQFEESRIDRSFNKTERTTNTENVTAYSANIDFTKKTGIKNTIYYGVEYIMNDVTSKGVLTDIVASSEETGPARYPNSTWESAAVYLNDEFKVCDKFTLQGGVRYNQYSLKANFDTTFYPFPFTEAKLNNGALTGSVGGVYRPTDKWMISANFGTAFRSPNVDDVGKVFDSEPGAVTVPNPDLKAEYAYNVDFGMAKLFGDYLKVDFTAYYTILQNALVRRDFQLAGLDSMMYAGEMSNIQAIQNAAEANVYGVQAGVDIKLPQGFSFSSNINYQKGEEELDDGSVSPSRHAAPLFGITRLKYTAKKLTLQIYADYQGEKKYEDLSEDEKGKDEIYAKDKNGNNYAPAWYTLNFKAMYRLSDYFTVNAGVENITDQRYRPYSSGVSAAGRNVFIALKAHF